MFHKKSCQSGFLIDIVPSSLKTDAAQCRKNLSSTAVAMAAVKSTAVRKTVVTETTYYCPDY